MSVKLKWKMSRDSFSFFTYVTKVSTSRWRRIVTEAIAILPPVGTAADRAWCPHAPSPPPAIYVRITVAIISNYSIKFGIIIIIRIDPWAINVDIHTYVHVLTCKWTRWT